MSHSKPTRRWLSTTEAADAIGMTPEWVREQIYAQRLPAWFTSTGRRRVFRIRAEDWDAFLTRYHRRSDGVDW